MSTISAIYGARKAAGLDDETARDIYERETGERSLRAMKPGQQVRVLQALNALTHTPAARDLAGPYGGKLRALWISGWNLGVVRNRTDAALLAFVTRQTGIEHTRFLRDAAHARKAVEALKSWLAREADVDWGRRGSDDDPLDAVIAAQGGLLKLASIDLEADPALDAPEFPKGMNIADVEAFNAWRRDELDHDAKIVVSKQLGASIRKANLADGPVH